MKLDITQLQRYAPTMGLGGCISIFIVRTSSYLVSLLSTNAAEPYPNFIFDILTLLVYLAVTAVFLSFILIFKELSQFILMRLCIGYLGINIFSWSFWPIISLFIKDTSPSLNLFGHILQGLELVTLAAICFFTLKISRSTLPYLRKLQWLVLLQFLVELLNVISHYLLKYLIQEFPEENLGNLFQGVYPIYIFTTIVGMISNLLIIWFLIAMRRYYKDKYAHVYQAN